LERCERVAGMTFDAQHFRDYLKLFTRLAEHLETYATADVGQLSWQVNKRSFRADIFRCAFGHDVCAAWVIPLGFYLETGEVARA
jgi:hypothetical protein